MAWYDFLTDIGNTGMNIFGASPSKNVDYMQKLGLLGKDAVQEAQKQSLLKGLLTTGLTYAALPKNQGYGSIFPYLARAGIAGSQAAQSPFDALGQDALTKIQLEELAMKKQKLAKEEDFRKKYQMPELSTTQINPNQQVNVSPYRLATGQDYGVGSKLMGGRTTPAITDVSPDFRTARVDVPTANALGVTEDQLEKTTTPVDPTLKMFQDRYKQGLDDFNTYYTNYTNYKKGIKPEYKEEDPKKNIVKIDPVTGERTVIKEGVDTDSTKISNDRDAYANTYKGQINSSTGQKYPDNTLFKDLNVDDQRKVLRKINQDKIDVEIAAETEKLKSPAGKIDLGLKLADDYQAQIKDGKFAEQEQNMQKVIAAVDQNSPIGDVAAATSIMKLLDPGSVVRESELRLALDATGVGDRLYNWFERNIEARKITPDQAKEFKDLAKAFYKASEDAKRKIQQSYLTVANKYNLDPLIVIGSTKSISRYNPNTGDIE